MAAEIELTDDNFESEILKHDGVAVVDFFATWCGPCKAFAPTFAEFAAEAPESVKVAKADVDKCPTAAGSNGVMSVPTIAFFKGGAVVDKLIGAQSKAALTEKVQALSG
ncbi:MAG: thioredoxin [Planctomycetota bacterium]|jgi:thioredoxin 1